MIISRMIRWIGHVASVGKKRNEYCVFVGNPEGKRPLGRPRRVCKSNIKMDLRKIGWDGMKQIHLSRYWDKWRALVNRVMNPQVPKLLGNS
jgi:hypothetical protein